MEAPIIRNNPDYPSEDILLPDIWGEGAIFAFSGLDGETCSSSGFMSSFDLQPFDLLIHTPRRVRLQLRLDGATRVLTASNDTLRVESPAGTLLVTFSAWHTLVGSLPEGVSPLLLALDPLDQLDPEPDLPKTTRVVVAAASGATLALSVQGRRFALTYGATAAEAETRAAQGLRETDLSDLLRQRCAWLTRLPEQRSPAETRFLRKCASVMKVNTLSPEAAIRQHWSTPDRIPHQHMWLWDSVFHSIGMNWVDPDLSWEFLQAMLDHAQPDGCMPITVRVDGFSYRMTQPPVLAWGVWRNYQVTRNRERLAQAAPTLAAYLEWNLNNRDQNGNGLMEWLIEENEQCRSGESGMDNSPRFDSALTLDAVDFSTFQAVDMHCLGLIYAELAQVDGAILWESRARRTSQAIHTLLWNPAIQFYTDRDMQGSFTNVRASCGFLPLLLPDIPESHVQALLAALKDPSDFASAFPVPSVSLDHPEFSTDMWRGSTWVNFNYLVAQGLKERGYDASADELVQKTLSCVRKYYEQFGVIFEFFDSTGQRTPPECDRKGPRALPYNIRRKYDSIRDYHWTAALCLSMIMEARGK